MAKKLNNKASKTVGKKQKRAKPKKKPVPKCVKGSKMREYPRKQPVTLNGVAEFKSRLLPWGETGTQAEARLFRRGDRPEWIRKTENLQSKGFDWQEAAYEAMILFPPEAYPDVEVEEQEREDVEFIKACKEALRRRKLQNRGPISDELDWVAANLNLPRPDMAGVPSRLAINWLMDARRDPAVRRDFWKTVLSKRLSPGEKRKKQVALAEDDQQEETEGDEDLMERLFGDDSGYPNATEEDL